ncbi:Transmembrane protease serine 9 [Amphibalanus amphitrite]|uniref:Transmembrane protease serine 9 n=1 Tax=Amphibalanus amphitrite TaxID=1232801 RepID=A0A6A4WM33_AMPAM|nr:Transmembrane protease serine 9 [Amphibalanus amphitrite]
MRPPPPVTALVLALLVSAPTAAKRPMLATAPPPVVLPPLPTANGLHPDLLPADCGRRPVPPPAGHQPQLAGHPVENPAYTGQFPWHVRLVAREPSGHQEHRCSGLIVSQWHVLTAADCVWNTLPSQVFVRVADVRISVIDEGEHDYAVTDIHVHHARDGAKLADNVALLRLAAPLVFSSHVQPACLPVPGAGHAIFLQCEIAGWGRANSSDTLPNELRSDAVPLASDEFCTAPEVFADRFVRNRTVCSGPNRHGQLHSCRGDAGAGLTCLDQPAGRVIAYGLLSAADKQGCGRRAGIYAKLSGFVDWIMCHVKFDQEGGTGPRPPLCGMQAPACGRTTFRPELRSTRGAVRDGDLPWIVVVASDRPPRRPCTGVIVSARWILTAAECAPALTTLEVYPASEYFFRANPTAQIPIPRIEIERIEHRANPDGHNHPQNLALLRTRQDITFSARVSPICVRETPLVDDARVIFAGQVAERGPGQTRPFALEWARMRVVGKKDCEARHTVPGLRPPELKIDALCTSCEEPTLDQNNQWWSADQRRFTKCLRQSAARPADSAAFVPPEPCRFSSKDRGGIWMSVDNIGGAEVWSVAGLSVDELDCNSEARPDVGVSMAPAAAWVREVLTPPEPSPPAPVPPSTPTLTCVTPDLKAGRCLKLQHCPALALTLREIGLISAQQYICGRDGTVNLVCCPADMLAPPPSPPAPPALPAISTAASARLVTSPILPVPLRLAHCGVSAFNPSARMGADRVRNLGELPWMAAVYNRQGVQSRPLCAGAVLSERWILTGASCAETDAQLQVELGTLDVTRQSGKPLSAPLLSVPIAEIVRHPAFKPPLGLSEDMALLRTATPIPLSSAVSAICLPEPDDLPERAIVPAGQLILAGWGAPKLGDEASPVALKWARMDVVGLNECELKYSQVDYSEMYLGSNSFCSSFPQPTAEFTCAINQGDQGSLFMHRSTRGGVVRWQAVGLAVGGIGCSSGQFPDINVAVAPSADWIRNVTGL